MNKILSSVRVGETKVMNNGLKATIIVYNSCTDMVVRFENGIMKFGVSYNNFKKGYVSSNNNSIKTRSLYKERIGLKRVMNCGLEATIIDYNDSNNITVEFEDGNIRHGMNYYCFMNGSILPISTRKNHLGEERTMKSGKIARIINYRNLSDVDVKVGKRTITNIKYNDFLNGEL